MKIVDIGGIKVRIISASELVYPQDKKFIPFYTSSDNFDITWRFIKTKFLNVPDSIEVKKYLELSSDYSEMLTIESTVDVVTILDFKINCVNIFFNQRFASKNTKNIIGSLLFAVFMPQFSSMLLHSSAILRSGKVNIFVAPDEGGKTTSVLLSDRGKILCDDQVLIRKIDGRYQAFGTPWGLYTSKLQGPANRIFLLRKSDHFDIQPLSPKTLSAHIWKDHRSQLLTLPESLAEKSKEIVRDICNSIPAWTLSFTKDFIDWNEIDKLPNIK